MITTIMLTSKSCRPSLSVQHDMLLDLELRHTPTEYAVYNVTSLPYLVLQAPVPLASRYDADVVSAAIPQCEILLQNS